MNYQGLNDQLRPENSIAGRKREWKSDVWVDSQRGKSAYTPPVQINKGTMQVSAGGIVDFQDADGVTIFTYDASSGAIAITGDVEITGDFTLNGTTSTGTISSTYGTFSDLSVGTMTAMERGSAVWINVSGTAVINEILMASNNDNKIRENNGLGLALADKVGAHAVRIQNSDLTDLVQFNTKGGMTLIPQAAPGTPDTGQVYYDSTANKLIFYNGGAWETVTSST